MKEPHWQVEEQDALLPFLLSHARGYSRNNLKSLLTGRQVLVDGVPVSRHDHPLAPGQTVCLAPRREAAPSLPFPILYEDERLLVVDKPAGLLTVANEGERLNTAYRMVTAYVRGGGPEQRIFIVHRLDRDTSGVLLFAKDPQAKAALQDNWDHIVRRRSYAAVVEGVPPQQEGTVRSFLRETATHLVYEAPTGKEAVTHYRVLRQGRGYSLVAVEIETGRKNQIRVQLSGLGCPVVGDKQYGARTSPLGRLCLHAVILELDNPLSGQPLALRAPAPRAFARLCGR